MSPIYVSTENIQQQQQQQQQQQNNQTNNKEHNILEETNSNIMNNNQYNLLKTCDVYIDKNNENNKTILDLPIEIIFHIFTIERGLNFYNISTPIIKNYRGFIPSNSNNSEEESINANYNSYNKKTIVNTVINFSMTCKYYYYLFQDDGFWYRTYKSFFSNYSSIDIDKICLSPSSINPIGHEISLSSSPSQTTLTTLSISMDETDHHNNNKLENNDNYEYDDNNIVNTWKERFIKRNHPWNYKDIKCRKEIQCNKGITSLEVDDKYLFSGSHDTNINLYELGNGLESPTDGISVFKGHQSTIWALKSDGKRLYSGSNDHTIRIWDLQRKRLKHTIHDTTKIFSIAIANEKLIFSSSDNNIKCWNRKSNSSTKLEHTLKGHIGGVNKIQIKDSILYSGSSDGSVIIWDLNTLKPIGSRIDPTDKILSLQMINSNTLVTGSQNCQIKFWDLRLSPNRSTNSSSGSGDTPIVSLINAHKWEVWQLEMCGGYLFSGSFDHTIKIWDLNNFKNLSIISSHRSYIHALTSSSFHLFSGSADKFIKVFSD
ncbi:hypothetical protein RB653_008128 [Dictyostelium firmibasis]|uniref:Uncharacterized protein n=1 Tax=Dictyostelium firmibasis TaxID=79012 RepID=A0AAN7TYD1_9MYCE